MTRPTPSPAPSAVDIGRAVWLLDAAERACTVLAQAGVRVCVVKGASLLGWIYAMGERPMQDVDLLIAPRDRARAASALLAAGYTRVPRPHSPTGMWLHPTLDWQSPSGVLVDLHTTLGALLRFPVPSAEILARAVAHPSLGPHALRHCHADAIVLHALDVAKDDGARKRSADEDLARLLAWQPSDNAVAPTSSLDLAAVVERAHRYGCAGTLWWRLTTLQQTQLQQTQDRPASRIPASIVRALRPSLARRVILRRQAARSAVEASTSASTAKPGALAVDRGLRGLAHSDFAGRYVAAAALFAARSLVDRALTRQRSSEGGGSEGAAPAAGDAAQGSRSARTSA